MQDKLLDFGTSGNFSGAGTAVYCENVLDLGEGIVPNYFGSGITAKVVYIATKATTGFTPAVYTGDTATPTAVCAQGPQVASMAEGDSVEIPVPFKVARYLRAGGSATSGAVSAHIEIGGVEA